MVREERFLELADIVSGLQCVAFCYQKILKVCVAVDERLNAEGRRRCSDVVIGICCREGVKRSKSAANSINSSLVYLSNCCSPL